MTPPCAVVATGPEAIRRLWPDPAGAAGVDAATIEAALDSVDDPVALVNVDPIGFDELWSSVLAQLCGAETGHCCEELILVYPSWWPVTRTRRVVAAAHTVADDVATHRRAWLCGTAAPGAVVVVEITARLVAITGSAVVAEPRVGPARRVAEAVATQVAAMVDGPLTSVVIDGPVTVDGAGALANMIVEHLGNDPGLTVDLLDEARLDGLAAAAFATRPPPLTKHPELSTSLVRRRGRIRQLAAVAAIGAAVASGVGTCERRAAPSRAVAATTFLIEGRVTLQVPQRWPAQRITAGPGSARVTLTSPSDPQVALHLTQSPVADEALEATAKSLAQAIVTEPTGVFIDFDPAGDRAGRAAVTYRERRAGHDIDWTILLDDGVRISIGCQSPPGGADIVRDACEQAVRTAHRLR